MSVGQRAARGAAWTIGTGLAARTLGVIGTLLIAHYLEKSDYGEVNVAAVVVAMVTQLTTLGVGQYVIAHPQGSRAVTFHASVIHIGLGAIAMLAVWVLRGPLGEQFDAPTMGQYVGGLAFAGMLDRIGFMPERVLVRDMKFARVSIARTSGELAFTACSIGFAVAGWGAISIVYGNIARAIVRNALMVLHADRRDWLEPTPLSVGTTRELLGFGLPLATAAFAGLSTRRLDNLLVSRFFGPGVLGSYNLAYNLAEIPASQVGEQIGDVLLPSFGRMTPEQRPVALVRSTRLLMLIMCPLAIGLGVVAPTVVATFFDERWSDVSPMLVALAGLAITRPIGWTVGSYLSALGRTRAVMLLELLTIAFMITTLGTFGRVSPIAACLAVGATFTLRALVCMMVIRAIDRTPLLTLLATFVRPLIACGFLVIAVWLARRGLAEAGIHRRGIPLVVEVLTGAAAYVVAALVVARDTSHELLGYLWRMLGRGRAPAQAA